MREPFRHSVGSAAAAGFTIVELLMGMALAGLISIAAYKVMGSFGAHIEEQKASSIGHGELREVLKEVQREWASRMLDTLWPPDSFAIQNAFAFDVGGGGTNCGDLVINALHQGGPATVSFRTQCQNFPSPAGAGKAHRNLTGACSAPGGRARVVIEGLRGGTRIYPRGNEIVSFALCARVLPNATAPTDVIIEVAALVRDGNRVIPRADRLVLMASGDRSPGLQYLPP